jgi:hypothetical protein
LFDLEEWRLQVDLFKNIQLPYGMVVDILECLRYSPMYSVLTVPLLGLGGM